MEQLTRSLVESHLMSFIEIYSEEQDDGVVRWAWALSPMADGGIYREIVDSELSFKFKSREAAINYAFGWIRRNRKDIEKAAVKEAKEGIRYRASIE